MVKRQSYFLDITKNGYWEVNIQKEMNDGNK